MTELQFQDNPQRCRAENCLTCLSSTTFDHVGLGVAHIAPDGRILRANSSFRELGGYCDSELTGRDLHALLLPQLTNAENRQLESLARGEIERITSRKALRRADGTLVPVQLETAPLRHGDGRTRCLVVVATGPENRWSASDEFERIAKAISAETGPGFFRSLVYQLTTVLGIDFAFVAELRKGKVAMARTVAACDRGQFIPNFDYPLQGTPCEKVLEFGHCSFPAGVQRLFPHDADLRALEIESYIGVPLHDSRSERAGLLVLLHRAAVQNHERIESMLEIFAPRAAAELERKQAEEALRRRERDLSRAQQIAHVGNWNWDVRGGRIHGSEEAYRILGFEGRARPITPDELLAVVQAEDRALVRRALERARTGEEVVHANFRLHIGHDAARLIYIQAEGTINGRRGERALYGTIQDVTEREAATEELRKLWTAVEQSADQIAITDSRGNFEYVNRAFCDNTGYAHEELIGRSPSVLKSGEQPEEFYRDLWSTILSGHAFHGVFINRRKNGDVYHEEKTITPVRNRLGEIAHFIASGTDITERIRAEDEQARLREALRNAAAEWRMTFDTMDCPTLVTDAAGKLLRVNRSAASLLGLSPSSCVGRSLEEFIGVEPWTTAVDLLRRNPSGRERSTSVRVERRGGRVTWDVAVTHPAAEENRAILTLRDVSGVVQLQESLRRSETMSAMGELVAGVAHEVRNPLFGIAATLDAFDKAFRGRTDHERYLSVLRTELGRLNKLMQELLEYGKPVELRREQGFLGSAVARAVAGCSPVTNEARVSIRNDVPASHGSMNLDESRLVQVFCNLLENAIQHSAPGAEVSIVPSPAPEGWVGCAIRDRGAGFRPDDLSKVFQPFFSRRRGGTGLGLSIVQRLVEFHGGKITAANAAGGGAEMSLLFPVAPERA